MVPSRAWRMPCCVLDYWREKVRGGSGRAAAFLPSAPTCVEKKEERESCGAPLLLQSNCDGPLSSAPPLPGLSYSWVAG
jgi:hypothetical protein